MGILFYTRQLGGQTTFKADLEHIRVKFVYIYISKTGKANIFHKNPRAYYYEERWKSKYIKKTFRAKIKKCCP